MILTIVDKHCDLLTHSINIPFCHTHLFLNKVLSGWFVSRWRRGVHLEKVIFKRIDFQVCLWNSFSNEKYTGTGKHNHQTRNWVWHNETSFSKYFIATTYSFAASMNKAFHRKSKARAEGWKKCYTSGSIHSCYRQKIKCSLCFKPGQTAKSCRNKYNLRQYIYWAWTKIMYVAKHIPWLNQA